MTKIIQENNRVIIHTFHSPTMQPMQTAGDLAIITIPFTLLQFVDVYPHHSFSYKKRKAITPCLGTA